MKKSCNNISQYLVFLLYFDQINVALEHMIDFLKTFFFKYETPLFILFFIFKRETVYTTTDYWFLY